MNLAAFIPMQLRQQRLVSGIKGVDLFKDTHPDLLAKGEGKRRIGGKYHISSITERYWQTGIGIRLEVILLFENTMV